MKKESKNIIGKHKTSIFKDNDFLCVKYWDTIVIKFNDEKIILNHGNVFHKKYSDCIIVTTKKRMNQASGQFNLGFSVTQENYRNYIYYKDKKYLFDKQEITFER